MARRDLGQEELALWQNYTLQVEPLKKDNKQNSPAVSLPKFSKSQKIKQEEIKKIVTKKISPVSHVMQQADIDFLALKKTLSESIKKKKVMRHHALYVGVRTPGIDNTQWKRLINGKIAIDARLDLHGYTLQDAFEEFCHFMHRARHLNWRCVEIITGLGSGVRGGMIRKEFPHWLQRKEIQKMIISVVHSHAGNQGAVRLLLKRNARS